MIWLCLLGVASADLIDIRYRPMDYELVIDGIEDHPGTVFLVYPVTHKFFGGAFIYEPGMDITPVAIPNTSSKRSRLWAVPRADFPAMEVQPKSYRGVEVDWIEALPDGALIGSEHIAPPAGVKRDDPRTGLERHLRIAALTEDRFTLEVVEERWVTADGRPWTEADPNPEPAPSPKAEPNPSVKTEPNPSVKTEPSPKAEPDVSATEGSADPEPAVSEPAEASGCTCDSRSAAPISLGVLLLLMVAGRRTEETSNQR